MEGNEVDRWIDAASLGVTTCNNANFDCADCLDNSRNDAATICYISPLEGGQFYPVGVETTVATFCAACPSGCGPFRFFIMLLSSSHIDSNQPSMYDLLVDRIATWPFAVRKALFYIGSVPVGVTAICFIVYVAISG